MTTNPPHNHIPAFRFPDFANDGQWEMKRLGEIVIVNSGRDYKHLNPGNIPVYGTGGYMLSVDDKLSDTDAIGIGRKGTIDKPQYLKAPFWTVDTLFFLTTKNGYDIRFVYCLLQTIDWKKYSEQTGVPSLTRSSIERIEVRIPPLAEQQRIAACLSAADEMITSTSGKLEQLKAYKKGMMQKLFPAKGKKLPELRFKEFENEGEWEEKKLETIVHRITTGKLDANAMEPNGKYRFYTCAKDYAFINEYAFDAEALLVSGNGAHLGYIHYYKGKFNAYQRTYVLSDFQCDIFYLKYYLERFLPDRINKEKKEGNTPYIVLSTLTEMYISIPSNSEQHKIADSLTSIDNMINQYTNEVAFLEQYKKGLMQQMFPTAK